MYSPHACLFCSWSYRPLLRGEGCENLESIANVCIIVLAVIAVLKAFMLL